MPNRTNRRRYESLFAALPPEEQQKHLTIVFDILAALIRGENWRAALPRPQRKHHRRHRPRRLS